jgi:hypothetical protein
MGREKKERLVVIDRDLLRLIEIGKETGFYPQTCNPKPETRNWEL